MQRYHIPQTTDRDADRAIREASHPDPSRRYMHPRMESRGDDWSTLAELLGAIAMAALFVGAIAAMQALGWIARL